VVSVVRGVAPPKVNGSGWEFRAASCSPPSIEWRERHALYSIQAKVAKRELVRMANSAIRNGPR